ncbi:hypothetical protein J5N97_007591 [Dioscorea zingiberensis]|uniref:Uncharacterized protein n=1 Tax=Dioscorea zingiberensis TaxID=325984 RepID=A0A9D5HTU1_9LILI|nr:hypothetical protein J5N97_007591 [Dioscorea zingiberensis]
MAMRRSLLLGLALLFLVLHGLITHFRPLVTLHTVDIGRKMLDFHARRHSHRQHHHHHHHHHLHHQLDHQHQPLNEDDGNEIDPRFGVEKRLVPTGPNPLHH